MKLRLLFLAMCAAVSAAPLRFEIKFDPSVAPNGSSGRMILFLADATQASRASFRGLYAGRNVDRGEGGGVLRAGLDDRFRRRTPSRIRSRFRRRRAAITSSWRCSIRITATRAMRRMEAICTAPWSRFAASIRLTQRR